MPKPKVAVQPKCSREVRSRLPWPLIHTAVVTALVWGAPGAASAQDEDPLALAQEAILLVQQATAKPADSEERFTALQRGAARALDARGALGRIKAPTEEQRTAVTRAIQYVDLVAPQALELKGVTHFFQRDDFLCALASTQMVLDAAGVAASEADLLRVAGGRAGPEGLHVSFFNNALKAIGLEAITGVGDSQLLRCALVGGRPVAVFQRVTLDRPTQHMRVVIGYDRQAALWIALDPSPELGPRVVIDDETFRKLWEVPWLPDGSTRWFGVVWRVSPAERAAGQ